MAAFIDPILRGVLFVFVLITLAITGSLAAGANHDNPQVNFAVFASAFAMLFGCFYGWAAAFIEILAYPIIIAILDFLNWVFLFAAATAIAANIHCHSCSNESYRKGNSIIQGSAGRCRKSQASVAFLYFSSFLVLGLLAYSTMSVFSSGAFGLPNRRKSRTVRTGVPTMSQV